MKIKPALDQLSISLVAIGNGSPASARQFVQEFQFDGEMYVDPSLEAYRAFKLKRGLLKTLGPTSFLKGLGAMKNGFRQGSPDGDLWQQGGLFVIGPGENITFAHRDRFAGDHANLDQVIASLES